MTTIDDTLSPRDQFALAALNAIVTKDFAGGGGIHSANTCEAIADKAYKLADAMIIRRKSGQ